MSHVAPLHEYLCLFRFLTHGQIGPTQRRYFTSAKVAHAWTAKLDGVNEREVLFSVSRREVGNWEQIDLKTLEADADGEDAR